MKSELSKKYNQAVEFRKLIKKLQEKRIETMVVNPFVQFEKIENDYNKTALKKIMSNKYVHNKDGKLVDAELKQLHFIDSDMYINVSNKVIDLYLKRYDNKENLTYEEELCLKKFFDSLRSYNQLIKAVYGEDDNLRDIANYFNDLIFSTTEKKFDLIMKISFEAVTLLNPNDYLDFLYVLSTYDRLELFTIYHKILNESNIHSTDKEEMLRLLTDDQKNNIQICKVI